jgi:hypothetical protein
MGHVSRYGLKTLGGLIASNSLKKALTFMLFVQGVEVNAVLIHDY